MSDICTKIVDGDHNPPIAQKAESEYIMISSKNVVNDSIIHLDDVRHLSRADFELSNARTQVSKGDVLFTSVASLGRTCIYDLDYPITFQRSVTVICTKIFNRYLKLFLDSPLYQNYVGENARGTAQKGFYINQISDSWVPIPPLNEQIRIVEKAQSLLDIVQIINYSKEETSNNIIALKSKILDLAISGKLVRQDKSNEPAIELLKRINPQYQPTDNRHYANVPFEIPKSWCWTTLGRIGKWQSGATPSRMKKEYYGGDIPWLKTGDLNDGFIKNIPESITSLALQETSVKLNPSGSVLLAMYGATIGKLGILTTPATTNQACCACVSYNGVEQMYLFYFLLSHRSEFVNQGGGGAQPNISKDKIIETLIPIPPLNEQRRIVQAVRSIFSILDRVVTDL